MSTAIRNMEFCRLEVTSKILLNGLLVEPYFSHFLIYAPLIFMNCRCVRVPVLSLSVSFFRRV